MRVVVFIEAIFLAFGLAGVFTLVLQPADLAECVIISVVSAVMSGLIVILVYGLHERHTEVK